MGLPNRRIAGAEVLNSRDHNMDDIRERVESYPDPTLCPEAAKRGISIRLVLGREGISAASDSTSDTATDSDTNSGSNPNSGTIDEQVTDDLKDFIVDWAHSD